MNQDMSSIAHRLSHWQEMYYIYCKVHNTNVLFKWSIKRELKIAFAFRITVKLQ